MNYHDNNFNNNYIDDLNIPKRDKNTTKKRPISNRTILIILIVILFIILIGMFFFVFSNYKKTSPKYLNNIIIDNNTYEPSFSKNIYDYYLITEDKEIEIKCDTDKGLNIDGCDEKIDLSNYSNYIHEIIVNENNTKEIYKVYIKVKESDSEKNIVINSINYPNKWTNSNQSISINATSNNKITSYSFDNGLSWQESNTYSIGENQDLKVIVKDEYGNLSPVREININNIDNKKPMGIIVKESSNDNKIVLKVIAKDEESGLDSYSWNGRDYSSNNKLTVKEKGTYNVNIKDKAGNIETISINIQDSDFNNKTQHSVTFYQNGSTTISNDFLSCTKKDGKCTVTLPDIERDNATIIGWSTNKDNTKAEYQVNEKISLEKDMILYAITKQEVTASFEKNGASSISSNKESCTLYNDDAYCYVNAPTITYDKGKIIGWSTNSNSQTLLKSPNNLIELKKDETYYALAYKEIIITFSANGADKISSTKEVCHQKAGSNSCFITTPDIIRNGATIIGWSPDKYSITADVPNNKEIEVSKDTTYYAITEKSIIISFDKNGADAITSSLELCSFYNTENSCHVTTPTITRGGATVFGWSSNKDSQTAELGQKKILSVNQNKTYYAITKKDVTATFMSNGSDYITSSDASCTFYNSSNGCTITMPDIVRNNWTILGWSTDKNATSASIKPQSTITIKDNSRYYAITYRKVTATYNKNTADSLGNCQTKTATGCTSTCNIYNMNQGCEVDIPYIYSSGNEVQFFSLGTDSSTNVGYSPAKKIYILDDVELNAIVDNRYRKQTYSIIKTKNYGYTAIETEKGCPTSVYNNYYSFLDTLYQKVPYIFTAAKVTFTSDNSFSETWGNYAGMTYGIAIGYRNVDVKCPTTYSNYYQQTIVHELVHSWDSYYYAQTGTYLNGMADIQTLYNKYANSSTKPLRDYAYTNVGEFIAEAYAWYYFLYIDSSNQPSIIKNNTYYPNDLKLTIEKYIKLAQSGYK